MTTMQNEAQNNDVEQFIQKCLEQGKNSLDDMVGEAQKELDEIEDALREHDRIAASFRPRKKVLMEILKGFGADPKASRKISPPIPEDSKPEDLTEEMKNLLIQVCEFLEPRFENNETTLPRDIFEGLNISMENDFYVYSAIQWLGSQKIIQRGNNGKDLVPGSNWQDRPTTTN